MATERKRENVVIICVHTIIYCTASEVLVEQSGGERNWEQQEERSGRKKYNWKQQEQKETQDVE